MTFLNLVRDASASRIELLERHLRESFPDGAFCLAVNVDSPAMLALTMGHGKTSMGAYLFPRSLFRQDRPRELETAISQYLGMLRAQGEHPPP